MLLEKDLTEMDYDEFQELIDNYIERSSHQYNEMPASTFLELLFENSAQRAQETIQLTGHIVDGKLEFALPLTNEEATIQTRGNQILVGDQLIVVTLNNGN